MVEIMKITATSFKRSLEHTAVLSASDPEAGHSGTTPPLETPEHSWACLGQFLVGSLLLSPGSWYTQGFVSALKESVSQLSSGRSMVGLMATSSKRSYSIPRSPAPRAAASAAVHCRLMPCRRHSNIVLSQSLWGFWVLVYPRFV